MNCKPGQRAWIVRASPVDPCVEHRIGCPVTVDRLYAPQTPWAAAVVALTGPVWIVSDPPSCPHGDASCPGLDVILDACLRPFDDAADLVVQAEQCVAPASEPITNA